MLDRIFGLSQNKTSFRTEVLAGLTTFLTMAYIIFVQPAILGGCGTEANPFPKGISYSIFCEKIVFVKIF